MRQIQLEMAGQPGRCNQSWCRGKKSLRSPYCLCNGRQEMARPRYIIPYKVNLVKWPQLIQLTLAHFTVIPYRNLCLVRVWVCAVLLFLKGRCAGRAVVRAYFPVLLFSCPAGFQVFPHQNHTNYPQTASYLPPCYR